MAYRYCILISCLILKTDAIIAKNYMTNSDCIPEISNLLRNSTNLVLINFDSKINFPAIRYDLNGFNGQTKKVFGDYVIELNDNETISDSLNINYLNTRAKFLIFLEKPRLVDDTFRTLSQHFIYDVFIVNDNKIFTYFPYKYENVNEPEIKPFLITECKRDVGMNYFHNFNWNKLPKLWRNTTANIGWIHIPPYTMCYYDCELVGIEFDLLRILKEKLMFNISESATRYESNILANYLKKLLANILRNYYFLLKHVYVCQNCLVLITVIKLFIIFNRIKAI